MPERLSNRDIKEIKHQREVVRAFMVQSAFHRDIASHVRKRIDAGENIIDAIADTSFMQVILMEKGQESTKNPGQLLPVGGNIEGKETPVQAMKREMQEETQLRAYQIQSIGDMTYTHTPKKQTAQDVHAQYFVADIAPSDHAFALHPEEDKSNSFPHLTYKELVTLWSTGSVQHSGIPKPMLDSLWPSPVRENSLAPIPTTTTPAEEGKMWNLMRGVAAHMERREFEKRSRVIDHMRALLPIKNAEKIIVDQQIQKKLDLPSGAEALDVWYRETLELLQSNVRSPEEFVDIFMQATEMANFEEEITHAGNSEQEASLRFMMTLLDLDFERNTYLELAKSVPILAPLAQKIDAFVIKIQEATGVKDSSTLSHQTILETLSGIDVLDTIEGGTEQAETFLRDTFRDVCISPEYQNQSINIGERLTRIHTFLDEMHKEIQHFGSKDFSVSELSLYDDIRNADMTSLLKYAVPTSLAHVEFEAQGMTPQKKRSMVFEARRSLVLLMQFAEYDAAYDAIIDRKNQHIQRIIAEAFPSSDTHIFVTSWESDETLPNGMPAFRKKEYLLPQDAPIGLSVEQKELRTFTDSTGQVYYLTTYDRTKSRSSYYRKILVRGGIPPEELTSDVYARSIVLSGGTSDHPYRSERIKRSVTSYPVSDIYGEVSDDAATKEFEDESAVFAVMDAIEKSAMSQGKNIRIIDYKPTPRLGQSISSSGVGGGAAIRLAKWYVEYISPSGKRTREEIQVFTPTLDPETKQIEVDAFAYEQQKKDDDHSYAVQRLLQTQGLRSVVELLWPNRIYGDIFRKIHNKSKKQAATNSRKKG
jgi:8-oxo-dGTP pyrophosphatase MutT (NUDIX family)